MASGCWRGIRGMSEEDKYRVCVNFDGEDHFYEFSSEDELNDVLSTIPNPIEQFAVLGMGMKLLEGE